MKIVLLAKDSMSSRILYNFVNNQFSINRVIIEPGASKKKLLKRRIKKQGWFMTMGQSMFQVLAIPILKFISRKRREEIVNKASLDFTQIDQRVVLNVNSINDNVVIEELKKIQPDVVIISGTRIISEKVLGSTNAPFLNIHVGITPMYRGVHGAYWALANNDPDNCGVTLHFVDKGIDTGNIISQDNIRISNKDNFVTYPLLQLSKGLMLLLKALALLENKTQLNTHAIGGKSKLWYHPTLIAYLKNRVFKGVK